MTDYIEQMMETAGVKEQYYSFNSADGNIYTWELDEDGEEKYNMCFIGKPEIKQRLFTAEKQLELIKLIAIKNTYLDIEIEFAMFYTNNLWGLEFFTDGGYTVIEIKNQDFTQALARFTTKLMNVGELDKKKVKGILEC